MKPPPGGIEVDTEGDTDDTERVSKWRRVEGPVETEAGSDSSVSSATVVPRQTIDGFIGLNYLPFPRSSEVSLRPRCSA